MNCLRINKEISTTTVHIKGMAEYRRKEQYSLSPLHSHLEQCTALKCIHHRCSTKYFKLPPLTILYLLHSLLHSRHQQSQAHDIKSLAYLPVRQHYSITITTTAVDAAAIVKSLQISN